nr:hypothetical protein Iba_chr12dCG17410 [Ipomoea batatas]
MLRKEELVDPVPVSSVRSSGMSVLMVAFSKYGVHHPELHSYSLKDERNPVLNEDLQQDFGESSERFERIFCVILWLVVLLCRHPPLQALISRPCTEGDSGVEDKESHVSKVRFRALGLLGVLFKWEECVNRWETMAVGSATLLVLVKRSVFWGRKQRILQKSCRGEPKDAEALTNMQFPLASLGMTFGLQKRPIWQP